MWSGDLSQPINGYIYIYIIFFQDIPLDIINISFHFYIIIDPLSFILNWFYFLILLVKIDFFILFE